MVVKRVTWLHEVVCTTAGKHAAYQDISLALFVQCYMIIMKGEVGVIKEGMATHLEDLMSDPNCTARNALEHSMESVSIKLNKEEPHGMTMRRN